MSARRNRIATNAWCDFAYTCGFTRCPRFRSVEEARDLCSRQTTVRTSTSQAVNTEFAALYSDVVHFFRRFRTQFVESVVLRLLGERFANFLPNLTHSTT